MVFEDVGCEHNRIIIDFTPKADNYDMGEGLTTSMLKPHILKYHIPEHPTGLAGVAPCWRRSAFDARPRPNRGHAAPQSYGQSPY